MNTRPQHSDDLQRLNELLPRLVESRLDTNEEQELATILQRSPDTQPHYLAYLQLHAELTEAWGAVDENAINHLSERLPGSGTRQSKQSEIPTETKSTPKISPIFSGVTFGLQSLVGFLVLVIGGLSAGLWISLSRSGENGPDVAVAANEDSPVGQLADAVPPSPTTLASDDQPTEKQAELFTSGFGKDELLPIAAVVVRLEGNVSPNLAVGRRLTAGTLRLPQGSVQMEFMSGAVVALDGPAELQIHSKEAATLISGAVSAHVPKRAQGFVINAPQAAIVDLGTEFGVRVTPSGVSEVEVLSGEVELSLIGDDGNTLSSQRVQEASRVRVNRDDDELQQVASGGKDLPVISGYDDAALGLSNEYAARVRDDEPLVYWRFEEDNAERVRNEMGSVHFARLIGQGQSNENIRIENGYVRFQRSDVKRYLMTDDALQSFNENPYSIEFWMKPDDLQHATCLGIFPESRLDPRIFLNVIEIVTDTFMIHEPGAVRFLHRTPPNGEYEIGKNAFSPGMCVPGQWHHVVAVKTFDAMEIHINGQKVRQVVLPKGSVNSEGDFQIVVGQLTANEEWRQFSGAMDEFAVYGRALTSDEIAEHYRLVNRID